MITALCVRKDSIYKKLGLDCYDQERDMRTFQGGNAVICHPPCAQWSALRGFARVDELQKTLAIECVHMVRKFGGVLEHPAKSIIFENSYRWERLPKPGMSKDPWGGYTICINQHWFGHKAEKKTFLYICGCDQQNLPPISFSLDAITHVVGSRVKRHTGRRRPELSKKDREVTPTLLAEYLIKVAEICDWNFKLKKSECSLQKS
jgi:hypothetical protein